MKKLLKLLSVLIALVFSAPIALLMGAIASPSLPNTFKRGMSVSQFIQRQMDNFMRNIPVMGCAADAIDVTGQTTEVKRAVFVAAQKCYVVGAKMIGSAALAASDTNYITVTLKNGSNAMAATPPNTKVTGGNAIVANTPWTITVDQKNTVNAGEVVELSITPATTSVANDLANVRVLLVISYDDDDVLA